MNWTFEELFQLFSKRENRKALRTALHGIEKESLRVTENGELALTPHPEGLGSAMTNPNITTDFAESQLEFITPPFEDPKDAIDFLLDLHKFAIKHMEGEHIWPFSMPAKLPAIKDIPIAQYGKSPEGITKTKYREGLAHRYGKMMQTLCGVHYNFSFSDDFWDILTLEYGMKRQDLINEGYLAMVRNFTKHRWILTYLFGASPVADKSYTCNAMAKDKAKALSLRNSRCGYSNPAALHISYNKFSDHETDIHKALSTHHKPYEGAGLNANLLQIPNEYYFPIRLKPFEDNVNYVEVRIFDLAYDCPVGVSLDQIYFTQLLLTFCFFMESSDIDQKELDKSTKKQERVALCGRELDHEFKVEGLDLLEQMTDLAKLLGKLYEKSLKKQINMFKNPNKLPAMRMLKEMGTDDFLTYGIEKARKLSKTLGK